MANELGDAPVSAEYRDMLNKVMAAVDQSFNGTARGKDRKVGIVMLLFPYGEVDDNARVNFISNGANRKDLVVLMKEMIARFEGQPEIQGRA